MKQSLYRFLSHVTIGNFSRQCHEKYKLLRKNSVDNLLNKLQSSVNNCIEQNKQTFQEIGEMKNFDIEIQRSLKGYISEKEQTFIEIQNIKNYQNNLNEEITFLKNNLLQRDRSIIFVHSLNLNNTGDANCAPYKYFQDYWSKLNISVCDISNPILKHIKKDDVVIIGGGGLMNFSDDWNHKINQILEKSDNVICWALGFNEHYDAPKIKEKIQFNKFKLVGNRDWKHKLGLPYLPCVSCMIEKLGFDNKIKRKIGIVEHQDYPIPFDYYRVNNKMSLDKMIDFIGTSEIIITNGYHAMYWATLMGKKVVLYKPFSSRYDHFKFKPVLYSGDLDQDIKKTKIYKDALQECRDLTKDFFEQVQNIIENKQ